MLAGLGIERTEGLVHQEDAGLEDQRSHNGRALLHAAGQLAWQVVGEVGEADEIDQLRGPPHVARPGPAKHFNRQENVLHHRAPAQQDCLLEDQPDLAAARAVHWPPVEHDAPFDDRLESADAVQQRGLAAAAGTDQ